MYPSNDMSEVINGKRYSVKNACCLAGNDYWDGSNHHRGGRNEFLFKTTKGNYFRVGMSMWQGERDFIEPLDRNEAKELFEVLESKRVSWESAFNEVPEEA